MTTAVLLRSGMIGNYHVPFCRAVEGATPSLTLIIEKVGVGHIHDSKRTGRKCKTEISAVSVELSTHQKYEQLSLFDCLGILMP